MDSGSLLRNMAFAGVVSHSPFPVMPPLPMWNGSPHRPVHYSPVKTIDSPEVASPSASSPFTFDNHEEATPVTPLDGPGSLSSPTLLRADRKKRIRRKKCETCTGCLRQEDCGTCAVCTNPNSTNSKCKLRRCELLKRRPSTTVRCILRFYSLIGHCGHTKRLRFGSEPQLRWVRSLTGNSPMQVASF